MGHQKSYSSFVRADVPLSSSGASAVSESSWPSARPVQISCCSTASAMGMTIAVVDVLLSHMDRNTVQHMKPSTNLDQREAERCYNQCYYSSASPEGVSEGAHMPGLAPATITMRRAMRL